MSKDRGNRDVPQTPSASELAEIRAANLTIRGDGSVMKNSKPIANGGYAAALKIARKIKAA